MKFWLGFVWKKKEFSPPPRTPLTCNYSPTTLELVLGRLKCICWFGEIFGQIIFRPNIQVLKKNVSKNAISILPFCYGRKFSKQFWYMFWTHFDWLRTMILKKKTKITKFDDFGQNFTKNFHFLRSLPSTPYSIARNCWKQPKKTFGKFFKLILSANE